MRLVMSGISCAVVLSACAVTADQVSEQTADLSNGARVYQSLCAFCHGDDGRGGTGGGTSLRIDATQEDVRMIVIGGQNMMPGLAASLSDQQILDVSAYVVDRFATSSE